MPFILYTLVTSFKALDLLKKSETLAFCDKEGSYFLDLLSGCAIWTHCLPSEQTKESAGFVLGLERHTRSLLCS